MARTGSGKSLAYMIPLAQRLGGRHSTTFGARSLILLPTRELALQILKVGKELVRGWHAGQGAHAGDKEESEQKGQSLRWGLVVGGEGMDEQFEMISNNPDMYVNLVSGVIHLTRYQYHSHAGPIITSYSRNESGSQVRSICRVRRGR